MAKRNGSVLERFWEKVDQTSPTDCWMWNAGTRDGYGRFWIETNVCVEAHRFAYEIIVGPITDGLELDHLCRVRACCNPAHLEPVTKAENLRRAHQQTHCIHGHPFDAANTYYWRTRRYCRTCAKRRDAERPPRRER